MADTAVTDVWSVNHTPTTATQATASKAAGAAGVKHVCKRVIASISAGATVQTPVVVNLRDGATGSGTILASWALAAIADGVALLDVDNLHLVGTAATAMTLEFAAAGASATQECCTIQGYDLP